MCCPFVRQQGFLCTYTCVRAGNIFLQGFQGIGYVVLDARVRQSDIANWVRSFLTVYCLGRTMCCEVIQLESILEPNICVPELDRVSCSLRSTDGCGKRWCRANASWFLFRRLRRTWDELQDENGVGEWSRTCVWNKVVFDVDCGIIRRKNGRFFSEDLDDEWVFECVDVWKIFVKFF